MTDNPRADVRRVRGAPDTTSRTLALALFVLGCSAEIVSQNTPSEGSTPVGGASSSQGGNSGVNPGAQGGSVNPSAGASSSTPGPFNLSGSPQYLRFVRLTNAQWAQSVQDILRLSAPSGLERGFQAPVAGTTDFTNNELVLSVDERAAADFQSAAESLAAQVTASSAALSRVYAGSDGAGFIAAFGRRAYRRPLTADESATYLALFNSGANLSGSASAFAKGAGLVIRAMLQSPYFLYRSELGEAGAALSPYEVASKLALWLRGTTPNDALLDSASGLDSAAGVAAAAATMLEEPAAANAMRSFHGELLHFERYATISKLGVSDYDPSLNGEYLEISNRFFDQIFSQGLGVKEILTSTRGFVGARTAALYGVTPPASGYVERELGATRVGYFSQLPFLSLYGLNADQDSIHRGVSLNLDVLCAALGPPATQLPAIPPLQAGQTNRQRISTLTSGCGGSCHNEQINPLGFAFEHFDGMGRYRDVENGNLKVDSSGEFTFSEGKASFADAAALMRTMASGKQAHLCYSKKLASFALQRDVVSTDLPLLEKLAKVSMENGSVKGIILELVKSDAFRVRSGGQP